jgi:hypothetical protein
MKKRTLSILLVLVLLLTLVPLGAAAADVQVSRQGLRVDGKVIQCEKYNIDGSNYFKLRDLAILVNGTGSQFSVGYDEVKRCISVTTGEKYTHNGTELDLSKGDQSASAVVSTQPLIIDGVERSDIQAYNIGGSNYYKLRDLGPALGFAVDYDPETNSAIVIAKKPVYPAKYLTVETRQQSGEYNSTNLTVYDEDGRVLSTSSDSTDYHESTVNTYDDLGRITKMVYRTSYSYDGETSTGGYTTTYTYNKWGLLEEQVETGAADDITTWTYTYDDRGNTVKEVYSYNGGTTVYTYEFDEAGLLRAASTVGDDYANRTEYEYDANGNRTKALGGIVNGSEPSYVTEMTYDADGNMVKSVYTSDGGDYVSTTLYEYDAEGRNTRTVYDTPYGYSEYDTVYDAAGNVLRSEYKGENYSSVTLYEYDAMGNMTRSETREGDEVTSLILTTYNEEGDPLTKTEDYNGVITRSEYTYDKAARKQTCVSVTEYPKATGMYFYDEGAILAVGDEYSLYVSFTPINAEYETCTWSSSDPQVAAVDEYGCVTALAEGEATITAVSKKTGLTADFTVTVVADKHTLLAEPASVTVKKGYTKAVLFTVVVNGNYSSFTLSFSGGDSSVATVTWDESWNSDNRSINLYVKGVAPGSTSYVIQVKHEGEPSGEPVILPIKVTE